MQDFSHFLQNHLALSLAAALLIALLFVVEFIRQKRAATQLSPLQLTHLINHQNAAVVDLRPTEAFAKGHIIGASSIPLSQVKENLKALEKIKNRPLVLVCAKGQDSTKLAAVLKKHGLEAQVLGGGLQAWTSAELPLSKD